VTGADHAQWPRTKQKEKTGVEKASEEIALMACHPVKELSFLKEKYFLLTGAL